MLRTPWAAAASCAQQERFERCKDALRRSYRRSRDAVTRRSGNSNEQNIFFAYFAATPYIAEILFWALFIELLHNFR